MVSVLASSVVSLEASTLTITPHECNMSGYSMLTTLEASTLTITPHECNMSGYSMLTALEDIRGV
jgi:predicted Zn-ribbon and HTH transcriptional regulator